MIPARTVSHLVIPRLFRGRGCPQHLSCWAGTRGARLPPRSLGCDPADSWLGGQAPGRDLLRGSLCSVRTLSFGRSTEAGDLRSLEDEEIEKVLPHDVSGNGFYRLPGRLSLGDC
ncbi:hypothetical protein VULLAG_LOCUS10555 [Vulpes lagopus]